ncbi:MAG TPA: cobalamin-independent methionine synthase II family protein [Dehalococcoidia bacterium]|nr:cobalamin-independent methionine synthase II family protein [Dehalococcoidia bacterium]
MKQIEAGVDVVNDGEYGKTNFLNYVQERLGGFEPTGESEQMGAMADRRDRSLFQEFYADELAGRSPARSRLVCTGPIGYTGQKQLEADIDNFKHAISGAKIEEAFMPALAPSYGGENRYYKTQDEFDAAVAKAMNVEYRAIVEAGFVLQIDDPGLPSFWDRYIPAIGVDEYRKQAARRVELVNFALEGVPEDRLRYHICWGSWHGPHVTDIPLEHVVDLMLNVRAQMYSIEAANARHEHEWRVWQNTKLPEGKILMPGVVGHATNVIEHPRLVADRIEKYADLVGRENVVAGTDCGLGGRVHPQICWAKLQALSEGAALASKELWA